MNSIKNVVNKAVAKAMNKCRYLAARCKHWCIAQFGTADNTDDHLRYWGQESEDQALWETIREDISRNEDMLQAMMPEEQHSETTWHPQPTIPQIKQQTDDLGKRAEKLRNLQKKERRDLKKDELAKGGKASRRTWQSHISLAHNSCFIRGCVVKSL
jgi:hypothetical protein